MQALIDVILPVFLVIGAGYAVTRSGFLNDIHIEGVMKFTQGFAIPCLLFLAIARLDLSASFNPGLMASFYTAAFLCFCVGLIGARILFGRPWEDSIAIGFCCLFSNSILLGLPITERAFGPDNLTGNYAIISFHAPFCYCIGITAMEFVRNRGKGGPGMALGILKAVFSNTLILGVVLGFTVNLSGVPLPTALEDGLQLIARAALPGALFALGGVLVRYKLEGDWKTVAFICSASLLLHPSLMWLFGTFFKLPTDLFRSGVINSAMPPGFNAYLFAAMYGRGQRVAASSVLIATSLALLTAWLWLTLLGG
ncbi:AEC family transporter [Chachezhania antarctica]|uniref:AEC family transporter n=1 Tax=Chachezhania antarctica TaxID=2340860 RepID=UPI000EADC1C5|nr:AEC family transporter [Chachezhania antarctica]|tara:strand:- start:397 stop:1329 length:933 start_codon:yes stop_codon:yes gene_type:complete